MDYRKYQPTWMEEIRCSGISLLFSLFAAWILYRNPWGVLLVAVIYPFCRNNYIKQHLQQREKQLLLQFSDTIQSVTAALLGGFSVENAWKEAERELKELHGENAYMTKELRQINSGISVNQPVEKLLYEFALRSGCEDILDFSEVFLFAKRSGGNFAAIMQNTSARIREKIEVEQEIDTAVAGRKMEQKVMNIVPIGLLAYLNLTSSDFLQPLYGNLFGACVMTFSFAAYLGALTLSKKMMDIRI